MSLSQFTLFSISLPHQINGKVASEYILKRRVRINDILSDFFRAKILLVVIVIVVVLAIFDAHIILDIANIPAENKQAKQR